MSDNLDDRLKELEKERESIIHESFISKQKQLDDQIQKSTEKLMDSINDEGSE